MNTAQDSPATRVLVVGAGPVGLTMAAALLAQGLSVRIIDKAPQASDKSKALVVWSRTLELFDKVGLADRFVASGMPAEGISVYGAGKRLIHIAVDNTKSPFARPLMIPQCETERLVTEHLTRLGLAIERGVELISFVEQGDGVVATLRRDGQDETASATWLLGCDGAHSAVRHILATPFDGTSEPSQWMLADVHLSGTSGKAEIEIYWHEKGILALFPIVTGRYRMIVDLGLAQEAPLTEPSLADVQAKLDERGPGGLKASNPVWLAYFRVNERKVSEYRHGRAFLAGDAAHIHSPAGGQGMNTGMQDAFNLAWKVALVDRGQANAETLLGSYSTERSKVGDQVLRGASVVTEIAMLRNPIAQFARNHIASLLGSFSFVQDKIRDTLGELVINYRNGPLTVEDWKGSGTAHAHATVHAGDRLPDAPLVDPGTGQRGTLFAATAKSQHTLILLAGDGSPASIGHLRAIAQQVEAAFPKVLMPLLILPQEAKEAATSANRDANIAVRIDCEGVVCQQHAASGAAVVVVRPDGYIGYRGQPAEADRLLGYLGKYLVRRPLTG